MDELLTVMEDIRDLLKSIDKKLDNIKGNGSTSLDDIYSELSSINMNTM